MNETHGDWFVAARYGLFIHYGLYSLLGRGEWARNRERVPRADYVALADRFRAERFDAEALCDLALRAGMRYVVLTTMHHEGFRLYHTEQSDFCTTKTACGRDLVAEVVAAARRRGLRIGLYHSLNNWHDTPDGADALESRSAYEAFSEATLRRVEEVAQRFAPFDVMWYDGWWPFGAQGWRAVEMNQRVRRHAPRVLFNNRNGLPGDFTTPEQHLASPQPWRPWEACVTLNQSWGHHAGDRDWKTPWQVLEMLATCAQGGGNLLLNVGPRGDGSIPNEPTRILDEVGQWLAAGGSDAIDTTDRFTFGLSERGSHRGDWCHHGPFTARGSSLHLLARRWPGGTLDVGGVEPRVLRARVWGRGVAAADCRVDQSRDRVRVTGLPESSPDKLCLVVTLECDGPPSIYLTGGMRVPQAAHPTYDPLPE